MEGPWKMDIRSGHNLHAVLAKLLNQAVREGDIPGAAVAVSQVYSGGVRQEFFHCSGYTEKSQKGVPVSESTVFDLASLTKPLVTVLLLLQLVEQQKIALTAPLASVLPNNEVPKDKERIELWQLLSHCSGLPAHRPYFVKALTMERAERKSFTIRSILEEPLEYNPGSRHLYSDLGFILLGEVIEQLTSQRLDTCYRQTVLVPLGLEKEMGFMPLKSLPEPICCAATEVCPWTNRMLAGVVHDDNCRVMGEVAGHAGLFGNAYGVLKICTFICEVWNGWRKAEIFSRELLHRFLTRREGSTWTCGFDTPSKPYSSSGSRFGPSSVGHLGYTGTSLWIDLARGITVVLLTNRVHPSRDNIGIRLLRPRIHDIIMEKLFG